MRLILIFSIACLMLGASMTAFGQSKIEAEAKLKVKADLSFPFVERQSSEFKWKDGKGGSMSGQVLKLQENDYLCDYSCSVTADLAGNAFELLETRDEGMDSEHHVYGAHVTATIHQKGKFWDDWGFDCDHEEEYNSEINLEVLDFTTEGWIDMAFIWGDVNWDLGPCWIGPLSVELTP